jgi:hypothetical protein
MKTAPLLIALCLSANVACAGELLLVDGLINDQPARFAFDTGASDLILFPKSAARFGVKWTNQPANVQLLPGQVPLGVTEECKFTLSQSSSRLYFRVFDLPSYPSALAREIDGILGWKPLNQNIFRISAADSKVEYLRKMPEETESWIKLQIKSKSEVLVLEIPLTGTNQSTVLVDTGAGKGVTISPQRWSEWKAAHARQPRTIDSYYMPGAGIVVKEEAWAGEFNFGPLLLTDVPIMEANQVELSAGGEGCDASLGLAALKQFDFILDGKNGFAYFHPKPDPRAPYQHNRLGAVFAPGDSSGGDLVGHVVDGSPAAEAGIRNGDVLLKIGDLDATKWQTDPAVLPLSRFWNRPAGEKLELTLKRGAETLKKTVVLKDILGPEKIPTSEKQK